MESHHRLAQVLQSLLGTDSGEESDGEGLFRNANVIRTGVDRDAHRHGIDAVKRKIEPGRGLLGVVVGCGDEPIDAATLISHQVQRFGAVGFGQIVKEEILPAEGAENGDPQRVFERASDTGEHEIREVDKIGTNGSQSLDQFRQRILLSSVLAL